MLRSNQNININYPNRDLFKRTEAELIIAFGRNKVGIHEFTLKFRLMNFNICRFHFHI